jgi:phosphatidylinositol/phosphatidylcholine transfer protein
MSGFYGKLTARQGQALATMQESIAEDDHTCLRFLRARHFDVKEASDLYETVTKYRKESGIEDILKRRLPKEDVFHDVIPHSVHGFDKDGRPIYIEKTGAIHFPTVYKCLTLEEHFLHHLYKMEHMIKLCQESTEKRGEVVENLCNIIDLKGLNMSHRKALKFIKMCADHDQLYYPERLGKVLIVNAHWLFPMFWKICSVWLDENTRNKIVVLGKNFKDELLEHVDADQLPEEYGGTCRCDGKQCVPDPDYSDVKGALDPQEVLDKHHDSVHIGRRGCEEFSFEIGESGGALDWAFKTHKHDISFSVSVEYPKERSGDSSENDHKEYALCTSGSVVDEERLPQHRGSFSSQQACVVKVRFDNSYSRFTSKSILYHFKLSNVDETDAASEFDGSDVETPLANSLDAEVDEEERENVESSS